MDGVGAAASIIQLVQVTQDVLVYVKHFKNFRKEAADVETKMEAVKPIITNLQRRVDEAGGAFANSYYRGLKDLDPHQNPNSIVILLRQSIQGILDALEPPIDWKRHIYKLQDARWHWDRRKIEDRFAEIDSYCGVITNVLSNDQFDLSLTTHDVVTKNFSDIKDRLKRFEIGQAEQTELTKKQLELTKQQDIERRRLKRDRLAEWLSPFRFLARQEEITEKSFPMGHRLLQSDEFQAWVDCSSWRLYYRADAGTGKTCFAAFLINWLIANKDPTQCPVLYLYLDHRDEKLQKATTLLGSLLKQLIQRRHDDFLPRDLEAIYDKTTERAPLLKDLERCFVSEVKKYRHVFVVIDGLDECSESVESWLTHDLPGIDRDAISILYTTRHDAPEEDHRICSNCGKDPLSRWWSCEACVVDAIADQFDVCKDCHAKGVKCHVATHAPPIEPYEQIFTTLEYTDDDITAFIRHELQHQLGNMRSANARASKPTTMTMLGKVLRSHPQLQDSIVKSVTNLSEGHVIFAKLCLDAIKDQRNVAGVKRVLGDLSANTDVLYDNFLQRIRDNRVDEERELALKALPVLAQQRQPLTFAELQSLLAVQPGDTSFSEDNVYDMAVYTESTKNLIVISDFRENNNIVINVRLFHATLDTYLKDRADEFGDTHAFIAERCLTYLKFKDLAEPIEHIGDLQDFRERYPLVAYAALFWAEHIALARYRQSLVKPACDLMLNSKTALAVMRLVWCAQSSNGYTISDLDWPKGVSGLHLCAWAGIAECVDAIVQDLGETDPVDDKFEQTPLMIASRRCSASTVTELLAHGAEVNRTDSRGRSAILEAIQYDQVEILRTLLAQPSLQVNKRITIQNTSHAGRTPLMIASSQAKVRMVEELLQHKDVDVNAQDAWGLTALMLAADEDSMETMQALLDTADVDVKLIDKHRGYSALMVAIAAKSHGCVSLLLAANEGSLLNDEDTIAKAFELAFMSQEKEQYYSVDVMLNAGANVKVITERGQTLLHMAAAASQDALFDRLLDAGLDIDARDNGGFTPLHAASSRGHVDAVKALIDHGCDQNLKTASGWTYLTTAWMYNYRNEIVRQKLYNAAPKPLRDDFDSLTVDGLPLWVLGKALEADLLRQQITVAKAHTFDTEPMSQGTALHMALDQEHRGDEQELLDVLQALVENAHLDVDAKNFLGRTPLFYAAFWGHSGAVRYLFDQDATVDVEDMWGRTPLALALWSASSKTDGISMLIEEGADVEKANLVDWGVQDVFLRVVEEGSAAAVTRLLSSYGADPLEKNEHGQTAYDIAVRRQDRDILKALESSRTMLSREVDQ